MKTYRVRTSRQADIDIENPTQILSLKYSAESFPVSTLSSLLKYGFNARCVYYKKMTILYTIHQNIVLIQRVIPGALLKK